MKIKHSFTAAMAVMAGFTVASTVTPRFAEGEENPFKVIYGTDNRNDLYDVSDPSLLRWADSTVALIDQKNLSPQGDSFLLTSRGFGESNNLCKNERFFEQKTGAGCSGTLVGKNLVLTSGHCVMDDRECGHKRIVFGFSLTEPGQDSKSFSFPSKDVYRCSKIKGRQLVGNGPDWALLELDRDVTGHEPMAVDRTADPRMKEVLAEASAQAGELVKGAPVVLISHPMGVPTKVDAGGVVRSIQAGAVSFMVTTDSFASSSGAPVLNSVSGKIVGILTDGEEDFNVDQLDEKRCRYSKRCSESECSGENVVSISTLVQSIPLLPSEQAAIEELRKKKAEAEAAKKAASAAKEKPWRAPEAPAVVKVSSTEASKAVAKASVPAVPTAPLTAFKEKKLPAIAFEEGSIAPSAGY